MFIKLWYESEIYQYNHTLARCLRKDILTFLTDVLLRSGAFLIDLVSLMSYIWTIYALCTDTVTVK